MSIYLISAVHVTDGVIDEVDLCDYDNLAASLEVRNRPATVKEVVDLIKAGHDVKALWRNLPVLGDPDGITEGTIPLQLVKLPDGRETFEVVVRGQPEFYRTALNLDRYEAHWTRVGLFGPHGTRSQVV